MSRRYTILGSVAFALNGLRIAVTNEPNFQFHIIIGLTALIVGYFLGLSTIEWIVLMFTIFFVLILELFNTAIEAIVDHLSPGFHPKAKIAKDVSAAAVFLSSIFAFLVGLILFVPKILEFHLI
jgi:undecaprenol kinase